MFSLCHFVLLNHWVLSVILFHQGFIKSEDLFIWHGLIILWTIFCKQNCKFTWFAGHIACSLNGGLNRHQLWVIAIYNMEQIQVNLHLPPSQCWTRKTGHENNPPRISSPISISGKLRVEQLISYFLRVSQNQPDSWANVKECTKRPDRIWQKGATFAAIPAFFSGLWPYLCCRLWWNLVVGRV